MPTEKSPLGQYFTPPPIAQLMVKMLRADKNSATLEPCSGRGVFLDALISAEFSSITAIEIDDAIARHPIVQVENQSFVSWKPTELFDSVIGNPPYIRWKNLAQEQKDEIRRSRFWGGLFNSLSDYLMVFIVNAIEHLKYGGEIVFITPSFWLHTQHAEPVRRYMMNHGEFTNLVSFGEAEVFPGVASSIIIFRFVKGQHSSKSINFAQYIGPRKVSQNYISLDDADVFTRTEIPQFAIGKHWTLASGEVQRRVSQIESWATRSIKSNSLFDETEFVTIGEFCDIANGMVSGLDKAFRVHPSLLAVLTQSERLALKSVAKAADLARLVTTNYSLYIDIPVGLSEELVKKKYPNLYKHLIDYRERLESRYDYGKDLPFWEWSFRRSEKFLTNCVKKIFVPCKERITCREHVRFSLVDRQMIATQDVTAICPKKGTSESVEYIAAYLCLDQLSDWIRIKGLIKGGVAEFSERPLASIPFRAIDWSSENEIGIHNRITSIVEKHRTDQKSLAKTLNSLKVEFGKLGLPERN